MPDTVLDIEATDMVDTMAMDTVMDTHTTDMDMDTTVARDPLMLTQLYSMVPMPHTPLTDMDMPHTDMPVTDTELDTTATHTADTDTIINLLLNIPKYLTPQKAVLKKSFEFV